MTSKELIERKLAEFGNSIPNLNEYRAFVQQCIEEAVLLGLEIAEGELKRLAHNDIHESDNWRMKSTHRVVHLVSALQSFAALKEEVGRTR